MIHGIHPSLLPTSPRPPPPMIHMEPLPGECFHFVTTYAHIHQHRTQQTLRIDIFADRLALLKDWENRIFYGRGNVQGSLENVGANINAHIHQHRTHRHKTSEINPTDVEYRRQKFSQCLRSARRSPSRAPQGLGELDKLVKLPDMERTLLVEFYGRPL